MRQEFDYDNWDTHRDMILRSYALDGNMLTWNEMGVFGKTSLGNESVYNSGFALTRYIAQKYGEDKLREITQKLGSFGNFTIDGAFEDILGKNGDEIYAEWQNFLVKDYKDRSTKVLSNLVEGEKIADVGFGNFYPTFSKDGKKIYYVSNKSGDYFSPSSIYEYDIESGKEKLLVNGVRSTFSWIPGTNKILYAKITEDNPNWYNVHDLFIYDVDKDDETRLTENLRANQPNVSNDGKSIVFLYERDGTTNLGMVDIDGKNFRALTSYKNGEQVYNPKFSNDDSYIIFDYSYHQTRDIAKVNANGGEVEFVIQTDHDERNPVIDKDGNLIYASDETGIFNIYSLNLSTKEKKQLTNVIGGAFMPDINANGDITYAGYTSSGYKIFLIKNDEVKKVVAGDSYVWRKNPPLDMSKPNGDINQFDVNELRNFNDFYIDRNYGTIVGQSGTILRTSDGGKTWTNQISGTSYDLYGISYSNNDNGIAVGENGIILMTNNGGMIWNNKQSGTSVDLWDVCELDSNNIFVVGEDGTILNSNDGGTNWAIQPSGTSAQLRSISFTDLNIGTIVGENGTILKTTNGGMSWIHQSSSTTKHLFGISFSDSLNGTAIGESG
ncbi:MAG: YCF48-related protein, partial [Ignavibacteriaceae bacterium]